MFIKVELATSISRLVSRALMFMFVRYYVLFFFFVTFNWRVILTYYFLLFLERAKMKYPWEREGG